MGKSKEEVIEKLSKYVGKRIIRTRKTEFGDRSYTNESIVLLGFTDNGRIIAETSISKKYILSPDFTDNNWMLYEKIFEPNAANPINKWRWKKVKRIAPTQNGDCFGMCTRNSEKAPTLVAASKHHVVIISNSPGEEGEIIILESKFKNPKDWVLA